MKRCLLRGKNLYLCGNEAWLRVCSQSCSWEAAGWGGSGQKKWRDTASKLFETTAWLCNTGWSVLQLMLRDIGAEEWWRVAQWLLGTLDWTVVLPMFGFASPAGRCTSDNGACLGAGWVNCEMPLFNFIGFGSAKILHTWKNKTKTKTRTNEKEMNKQNSQQNKTNTTAKKPLPQNIQNGILRNPKGVDSQAWYFWWIPDFIHLLERAKMFLHIYGHFGSWLFMGCPGNACDCYQIPIIKAVIGPMTASENAYFQIRRMSLVETKNAGFFPHERRVLRGKNWNI